MKLKALKPRLHNVIFHTHTVSGIVIGFALFICFYAGAFALFLDELYRWENPEARFETVENVDYDRVLQLVQEKEKDFDINNFFSIVPPNQHNPMVMFFGSIKTSDSTSERFSTYINPTTYEVTNVGEPKTHMARTIYELHFFHQIPEIGIYLAGLVGFFFLFAIITGVMIHWKNMVQKFYAFTVEGKWKQIWTNGHTVLGMITLPFQAIYAFTGALLGLSILLLAPSAYLLFNGDTNEIVKIVRPDISVAYDDEAKVVDSPYHLNDVYNQVHARYPDHEVTVLFARNYMKEDGTISARLDDRKGLSGDGSFVYKSRTGELISEIKPYEKSYTIALYPILIKLHYATYGGIFLKIIYFILAMTTCFIISSGVMIWYTARNKSMYTLKQRRFHHRVTKVYLALTQGLFPAIAIIFLANKIVPMDLPNRVVYVNGAFFLGWLALILIGLRWNNLSKLNQNYLTIGGALGLLIPIANGIVTGDWIWKTLMAGDFHVFSVDFSWIMAGGFALYLGRYVLPRRAKNEATTKLAGDAKPPKQIQKPKPAPKVLNT
ncbi:MAG: PepSY-associated TM helix domain-containing protein [Bacteroidota bacterium]